MTKEESAIKTESKDATKTRERSGRNRGQKKKTEASYKNYYTAFAANHDGGGNK